MARTGRSGSRPTCKAPYSLHPHTPLTRSPAYFLECIFPRARKSPSPSRRRHNTPHNHGPPRRTQSSRKLPRPSVLADSTTTSTTPGSLRKLRARGVQKSWPSDREPPERVPPAPSSPPPSSPSILRLHVTHKTHHRTDQFSSVPWRTENMHSA